MQTDRYSFIAYVKIKSVYEFDWSFREKRSGEFAQIEIIELFKGPKLDSIKIQGIGTSCDMGVKSGEEWVFYGNYDGKFFNTSFCTYSFQLHNGVTEWETDIPFFNSKLNQLRNYFKHSYPPLKNGLHEALFKDGQLKSRFKVNKGKLQGLYTYISDNGKIYSYNFEDGIANDLAFEMDGKFLRIWKFGMGRALEYSDYGLDSITSLTKIRDSFSLVRKKVRHRRIYLDNGHTITSGWFDNGNIKSIDYRNDKFQSILTTTYYETGNINDLEVYDENSNITTHTSYFPNGIIARKVTRYPDGKTEIKKFNSDGTLKE